MSSNSHSVHPTRRINTATTKRQPSTAKKPAPSDKVASGVPSNTNGHTSSSKPSSPDHQVSNGGEMTVKKLRMSKALTMPEGTMVSEACRRMAQRRVDAALLTDSTGMLSGIVTDKDIATRVIAEELRPEQTLVSKIMTRNPIFVPSHTLAIEALHTMVQGKFRHLPVVEHGDVFALLDITKCLYDAISRMEKTEERGSAIAAAVEGVEQHWGSKFSAQHTFIETLRERFFKPSLSTMITEKTKVAVVSPSDSVCLATKKMREYRINSVVIATGGKPQGILTSKDILMRVVAPSLCPELTLVEKVMTANPECATLETTILDALHIMHDKKFLHIPLVDHDGSIVACLDVLQIMGAAISMVDGGHGAANDISSMMMQRFWDSALPAENRDEDCECETHSELSATMTPETPEFGGFMYPPLGLVNTFVFKFEDQKGRVHRFTSCSERLAELATSVKERLRPGIVQENIQLTYEDDEGDRVLLVTDSDLVRAVNHAKSAGLKLLRLHLDDSDEREILRSLPPALPTPNSAAIQRAGWTTLQAGVLASALSLATIGVLLYLKRSKQ